MIRHIPIIKAYSASISNYVEDRERVERLDCKLWIYIMQNNVQQIGVRQLKCTEQYMWLTFFSVLIQSPNSSQNSTSEFYLSFFFPTKHGYPEHFQDLSTYKRGRKIGNFARMPKTEADVHQRQQNKEQKGRESRGRRIIL